MLALPRPEHASIPDDAQVIAPEDIGFICQQCVGVCPLDDRHDGESDGSELVCESCWSESHFVCDSCGDEHENDSESRVTDVCESCYDDHYIACEGCDHHIDTRGGGYTTSDGGDSYCDECYSERYSDCEECHCECWREDMNWDDDADEYLCDSCHADRKSNRRIKPYSFKVESDLSPFGRGPVRFGVELEVEVKSGSDREETAESVLDRIGDDFAVCKEDSSLNHGFEVVTAPSDLETHRDRWTKLLGPGATPRGLKSWDTETCGMHIHVSRRPLSEYTIGKLLVFVSAPENRQFVESIAGRNSRRWAAIHPKKLTSARDCGDRYQAINLCNRSTIEFRIFRGTLKLESVLRNVEFVAALVAFVKQASPAQLLSYEFARWVGKAPRLYPHLSAWLRERGFIRAPRTRPVPIVLTA